MTSTGGTSVPIEVGNKPYGGGTPVKKAAARRVAHIKPKPFNPRAQRPANTGGRVGPSDVSTGRYGNTGGTQA